MNRAGWTSGASFWLAVATLGSLAVELRGAGFLAPQEVQPSGSEVGDCPLVPPASTAQPIGPHIAAQWAPVPNPTAKAAPKVVIAPMSIIQGRVKCGALN